MRNTTSILLFSVSPVWAETLLGASLVCKHNADKQTRIAGPVLARVESDAHHIEHKSLPGLFDPCGYLLFVNFDACVFGHDPLSCTYASPRSRVLRTLSVSCLGSPSHSATSVVTGESGAFFGRPTKRNRRSS